MALSENRIVYGIHSICPYSRTTGLPYGILKVLGGGTISLSAEFEDLFGGSNKYAWASEAKTISAEFSCTVKSLPDFLFELFLGATVSTVAASATGTVSGFVNKLGTSVKSATTGIATVAPKAGSEADLKAGLYVIKCTGAAAVDVYALTDVDGGTFQNDALKITASPLTIVASTGVTVPGYGLELTGGSGVIGMTTDDTAIFYVGKIHTGISEISVGASSTVFPEHGQFCLSQKRSNGEIFEIEIFKCIGGGFPIALEETVFSIPELTIKVLYDSVKDAIFRIRSIKEV